MKNEEIYIKGVKYSEKVHSVKEVTRDISKFQKELKAKKAVAVQS